MPIILTEAERATAREIAKAITNEHFETMIKLFADVGIERDHVPAAPMIEFMIRTYERAFVDVATQIEHKRL